MFALKFELRATANGTNMFVEQDTVLEVSLNEPGVVDRACMIALGTCASPQEMRAISGFLTTHLLTVNSIHKFEEVTHGALSKGSYRIQ